MGDLVASPIVCRSTFRRESGVFHPFLASSHGFPCDADCSDTTDCRRQLWQGKVLGKLFIHLEALIRKDACLDYAAEVIPSWIEAYRFVGWNGRESQLRDRRVRDLIPQKHEKNLWYFIGRVTAKRSEDSRFDSTKAWEEAMAVS
ncbi:hypothetical protein AVEN_265837-1 [Araneus ventricosus]|uniref:Uncharacterized protein n=1 Tax=Araneus ventricosus TaxID=182803 RepID=A0A4Y2DWG1_ARAVE|nr:hypothetical protein AVEN_265837-1 [Araneus ventricosus]